jgi:hydantoinase/carbamoylase family amidase
MPARPEVCITELRELAALTSDERGAQRVAWTDTWRLARDWLRARLSDLPVEVEADAAGNLWATLPGAAPQALVIGSHLDSVPDGGWLDGALGVLAGLEVLRGLTAAGRPPVTVRLVDWADEEGARFGHSLIGSGAATGALAPAALAGLRDASGTSFADALARFGVDPSRMPEARASIEGAAAYMELHIEQGPVLEAAGQPLGVVSSVIGIRRYAVRITGRSAHAGPTPMDARRDPVLTASRIALDVAVLARRHGGVGTVGRIETRPGIATAIAATAELTIDLRHEQLDTLERLAAAVLEAARRHAATDSTELDVATLYSTDPVAFHPHLVALATAAAEELAPGALVLRSGALHDAAAMAAAGIPTVMLFVRSIGGVSHTAVEDSSDEDLALAVCALDALVARGLDWLS